MIDCHLHLQDPRFGPSVGEAMETARSCGITRFVVNGTCPEDWPLVKALAHRFPEVIPSYGLHPWQVGGETESWLNELELLIAEDPRACVGEIGLDRWIRGHDPERQREAFLKQLRLAEIFGRSLTIHCLKAWGTLLELIRENRPRTPFLLHSYGGPPEMVADFADLGAYYSLSGYFFREDKADKLATFDRVPIDRLLLETDAPDMLPPPRLIRFPVSGKTGPGDSNAFNHPANLIAIRDAAAARLKMDPSALDRLVEANFARWYHGSSA
ncbi:MAG: TatD family hydrolase [Verrucomicrobiae bacterium]|nr:TatD family hydrolase [Verrucomicrobiae bacterium]